MKCGCSSQISELRPTDICDVSLTATPMHLGSREGEFDPQRVHIPMACISKVMLWRLPIKVSAAVDSLLYSVW